MRRGHPEKCTTYINQWNPKHKSEIPDVIKICFNAIISLFVYVLRRGHPEKYTTDINQWNPKHKSEIPDVIKICLQIKISGIGNKFCKKFWQRYMQISKIGMATLCSKFSKILASVNLDF